MDAIQVGTPLCRVTPERATLGQAVTVETAAAKRSPGPQARNLRRDAPTSLPTCVRGESEPCMTILTRITADHLKPVSRIWQIPQNRPP